MVDVRHIDLGAQHFASIRVFAFLHLREELQVLLHRAVAIFIIRARMRRRTFLLRHLIAGAVVYIGEAFVDQLHGKFIELGK